MVTSISSITSQVLSNYAINGLAAATERLQRSTERLSTGLRINSAGDDPGGLSVATGLRAKIETMRQALTNTAQGDSLLQVAYGGLSEISDILTSMQSLATQANSASLTAAEFANLDVQFQELSAEIDSIAGNTSFGNIKLLDGSANAENTLSTNTTNATAATGSLNFAVNIGAGQTVRINNTTFTEGVNFSAGGSISASIDNLITALTNSTNTAISSAAYSRVGNTLNIAAKAGGRSGNQFLINQNTSTAAFTTVGGTTNIANLYTLQGGQNNGLNSTSITASGTIGDTLVNTQSQNSASVTLSITGAVSAGEQLRIDDGNGGFINFTFVLAPVAATDIGIGASTEDTIDNAVNVINRYSATNDYVVRQLEASRSGTTLVLSNRAVGNTTDLAGAVADIAETLANGTVSAATFGNGTNTGVNVDGITNASFAGSLGTFSATYVGADSITAQTTIGGITYSANITDTTPAANTTIRFSGTNGGFFDVQLAGGAGLAVTNQTDADTYAGRLSAAFSTLTFYQNRQVSNFTAAGQLANASFEVQTDDFSGDINLEDVQVTAPPGAGFDAVIDFTINGETYRSAGGLKGTLGDYTTITLTNLTDANKKVTFRTGSTTIDLSTQSNADTFESNLRTAFALDTGKRTLDFQVSDQSDDVLQISIGSATTDRLFNHQTPDLLSQANAVTAAGLISTAIDTVTGILTDVGAYQQRLSFASNNLTSSITAQDEARSVIEDTDIAAESTEYAIAAVLTQSSISVLAQTNTLRSSLLDLLKVA